MIIDKITHLFNFEKNKSTAEDLLSNQTVFNTSFTNVRSTALDSFAPYVEMNLRFDGPDSGFFFFDDCGNIITRNGTPFITTKDGRKCGYFDGADDWLTIAYSSSLNLSNIDFTIEFWVYNTSYQTADNNVFDFRGSTTGFLNWVKRKQPKG